MSSATIKIFLVHGDPKRLRIAELSNWTGKAVAGPRSEFDSVLARDESQNSGVYFLTGIDPETGTSAVYIGEAESIHLTPNGFVVLVGSQAVLADRPSSKKYPWALNMRQKLRDDGALAVETGRLVFMKDVEFSSPSAAAAVVHGGHANGLTAWKNKEGKTLKELESVNNKE